MTLRVAVTGGSGRIGSAVIRRLRARGHQPINLDIRPPVDGSCRHVTVDLTRREQVEPLLAGMDAVCHLGEIPNLGTLAPDHVYAHNTAAGAAVMQSAGDLGIKRLIYASSIQVYGMSFPHFLPPAQVPCDESHPLRPQQGYALSKVANELFAQVLSANQGISTAIFRFPWVCEYELSASAESEHWAWITPRLNRLEELGAYVHVSDAAEAVCLAVELPRPGCEVYQLCAPEGLFARPVRSWLREAFPALAALPGDWPDYRSPYLCDKFRSHFPWTPTWNLLDLHRTRYGSPPRSGAAAR